MKQLGTAKKLFHELEFGDKLYYIDPAKGVEHIQELSVKEVRKAVKPGWCVIVYYKSDEATKIIHDAAAKTKIHKITADFNLLDDSEDQAPVGKIIVPRNASHCMTMSVPPSVYYTNKKELLNWMGK